MVGPRKKRKQEDKKKGDIQSMIRNMPSKKGTDVMIKDDDILGELLNEISASKQTNIPKAKANRNIFCHTVHSNAT